MVHKARLPITSGCSLASSTALRITAIASASRPSPGEVYFDKSYEGNPLVNAFCLGVLRHEQIARGAAKGIGNPVFYVGPPTGRDGLAGASFASQDLTEESAEQQRGAVQVGDPFMEKLVCEACLELLATGAVAGIQDMGAAGLTCSTCETAARAGTGIEIELDKVPQRAPNMTSYDLMLSESQERMLIIVHKGREEEVKRIFDKWDLPWSEIGYVTDTGRMVVKQHGQVVADIPAKKIADESPVYQRDAREPAYLKDVRAFRLDQIPDNAGCQGRSPKIARLADDCVEELGLPAIRSYGARRFGGLSRQRRSGVAHQDRFLAGIVNPQTYAGQILIALTVDGNGAYVYLDPYEGGKIVVTEAARNLACSGAAPLGVTDNLNYGNPFKPELFWQLKESVRGLADACRPSTRRSPAAIARFTIKVPPGRLTPRPRWRWSASSKNRSTSRRNGSRMRAMPSFCLVNQWIPTTRCWALAVQPGCRPCTERKPARRHVAIWNKREPCTPRCWA
jgi:phosphoribosylformylglycinamidine synthase subunit PurL